MTIVAEKDNFYKIYHGTGFGYVSKDYIKLLDEQSKPEHPETKDDILSLIIQLEAMAKESLVKELMPASVGSINMRVLDFIRHLKYNGFEWSVTLGDASTLFVNHVKSSNTDLYNKFYKYISKTPDSIPITLYNSTIDLPHLAATIQGYILSPVVPDFWIGWGGDLATTMDNVTQIMNNKNDFTTNPLIAANEVIGNKTKYSFGLLDVYSDSDAIKLAELCGKSTFSNALEDYYKNYCNNKNRSDYLIQDILGKFTPAVNLNEDILTKQIINRMTGIMEKVPVKGLLASKAKNPTDDVLNNTCRAFAQYLLFRL